MKKGTLFVRVGWMKYYNGPQAGDEKPIGGGSYAGLKHEAYNFKDLDGQVYGFFRPRSHSGTINLARVAPSTTGNRVETALVVFFALRPGVGQVIVGWYGNAVLYSACQNSIDKRRRRFEYRCKAATRTAVLIPTENRIFQIPKGKGGTGESNVTYALDERGKPKSATWIEKAIAYVEDYAGPNILEDPITEAEAEMLAAAEKAASGRAGQPFGGTAEERKAIENRAMNAAKRYFKKEGYAWKDVHKRRSYDLLCTKGGRELYVEVKGTQGAPTEVLLTRGEVRHVGNNAGRCVLFILHGIRLNRTGKAVIASGGLPLVLNPWKLVRRDLDPLVYSYKVPSDHDEL